ncbi:MAG: YncE family protein, partial [Gemmatimonadaceae bacterium]
VDMLARTGTPVTWGKAAYAIAVSRDQRRAYLTAAGDALREVDLASGTFTDTPLGLQGFGLALSPDDRFAYVGTQTDRFLIVDLASKTIVARIQLPVAGLHITIDQIGRYAYVTWDSDVVEIDLTSRQMTRRFSVVRGQATALAPGSRLLYVGTQNGAVHRIDLDSGATELFKATPDCGSWGIGVTPDERLLYLACSGEGRVDVLDIASRQVLRQYTGYGEPRRVAVSDDGSVVVVATMNVLAIFR